MSFELHFGHADAANVTEWLSAFKDVAFIKTQKRIEYANIPSAFDIEATSFIDEQGRKRATMYVWQLGLGGRVIMGRTWPEFVAVLRAISRHFKCGEKRRLIMYVHFLPFEFQWFRKWLEWDEVFSTDTRNPLYAISKIGIEFRCSFMLSGLALSEVGNQLTKYKVKKLGDFDYKKKRHSKTPLTPEEYAYCEHDVLVVMAYIQEEIEREGNIARLSLTKTGYVRKFCRNACLYDGSHKHNVGKWQDYRELMEDLKISGIDEFKQLRRAFQGGFTHANARLAHRTLYDVDSWDFTSSYPYVMCVNRFPMSHGTLVATDATSFRHYLKRYCCLFDAEFTDLEPIFWEDNYISASKCWDAKGTVENNGRIVKAAFLRTTLTDVDFRIIEKFYKWKSLKVANFRIYQRGYLPTDFVKAIVSLYRDKTALKDVSGQEVMYLIIKGMVNASYGMAVTNPIQELVIYNPDTNKWAVKDAAAWRFAEMDLEELQETEDPEELLKKHNDNKNRFLFYPWGVWITAYARENLTNAILAFGDDYIYSDTDSIKAINGAAHFDFIESYNQHVFEMLKRAADFHNIPLGDFMPKTIKGEQKPLGVWDWETNPKKGGAYTRFKTLGAKRYMLEKRVDPDKAPKHPDSIGMTCGEPLEVSLTVSGLNKRMAIPYMLRKYGQQKIFDWFTNNLVIPAGNTGRKITAFIDKPTSGSIIDYTGQAFEYSERSSIYMDEGDYSLSMSDQYIKYIRGFREYVK